MVQKKKKKKTKGETPAHNNTMQYKNNREYKVNKKKEETDQQNVGLKLIPDITTIYASQAVRAISSTETYSVRPHMSYFSFQGMIVNVFIGSKHYRQQHDQSLLLQRLI